MRYKTLGIHEVIRCQNPSYGILYDTAKKFGLLFLGKKQHELSFTDKRTYPECLNVKVTKIEFNNATGRFSRYKKRKQKHTISITIPNRSVAIEEHFSKGFQIILSFEMNGFWSSRISASIMKSERVLEFSFSDIQDAVMFRLNF